MTSRAVDTAEPSHVGSALDIRQALRLPAASRTVACARDRAIPAALGAGRRRPSRHRPWRREGPEAMGQWLLGAGPHELAAGHRVDGLHALVELHVLVIHERARVE